jgi:hypothetical protein
MGCLPATTSLSKMYDSVGRRQQPGRRPDATYLSSCKVMSLSPAEVG